MKPIFNFEHHEGNWFKFIFRKKYFGEAKIFNSGSDFGIGGGRISKLYVQHSLLKNQKIVFNFDRSLDLDELPAGCLSALMEYLIAEHNKWILAQKEAR